MPDVPRTSIRYYVAPRGDRWCVIDLLAPCHRKIGFYSLDEATKLVQEMNATWHAATDLTNKGKKQ